MIFTALSEFKTFGEFWRQPGLECAVEDARAVLGCTKWQALIMLMRGAWWNEEDVEVEESADPSESWKDIP